MGKRNKRKHDMNDSVQHKKKYKTRSKNKKDKLPAINNIQDLIDLSKTNKIYKNIDATMLWNITPHIEQLNNMIGMKSLKQTVFYQVIYYLQNMHSRNQNEEYLHTIICGSPGTGKTTVAKILGKIYQTIGILSPKGTFKIAYRDDFIAEYLGQTAVKTRKLLKSCIGGVLFIDEVYSLAPRKGGRDSYSDEALDTLTAFLSEHKNDFCCIAAGYEEDIFNRVFTRNKGLERRFPWVHKIQDYSPEDLVKIMVKMVKDMNWDIGSEEEEIINLLKVNKKHFKRAGGDIETFLTKCKMVHAKRILPLDKDHKFVLTIRDMENALDMIKKQKSNINDDNSSPPQGMYI